jgi:hypothetical protein
MTEVEKLEAALKIKADHKHLITMARRVVLGEMTFSEYMKSVGMLGDESRSEFEAVADNDYQAELDRRYP